MRDIIILNLHFTDSWWDHANRINNQEFAAYGDKAYLYIPNSNQEHVVWLKPKLSTTNNWHWIGIYQNQRYSSYSNYKTGWTDVKGNLLLKVVVGLSMSQQSQLMAQ